MKHLVLLSCCVLGVLSCSGQPEKMDNPVSCGMENIPVQQQPFTSLPSSVSVAVPEKGYRESTFPDYFYAVSLEELHAGYCDALSEGPAIPGTPGGAMYLVADAVELYGASWKLREDGIDYISLKEGGKPVVYLACCDPHQKLKTFQQRSLTPLESTALERLPGGTWIVCERDMPGLNAMAAVQRTWQCAACHEETEQIPGAFIYHFEEIPDD